MTGAKCGIVHAAWIIVLMAGPTRALSQDVSQNATTRPASEKAYTYESVATRAARAKLQKRAFELDFDALPFEQVIEQLKKQTNLNIVVNWRALEAQAIEKGVEVTVRGLKDVKYEKALELILNDVGAGEVDLGYKIDDGVLQISTKEDLSREKVVRIYDLSDLVATSYSVRNFSATPMLQLQQTPRDSKGSSKSAAGADRTKPGAASRIPLQPDGAEAEVWAPMFPDIQVAMNLIEQTIDPESWRDVGGNVGSISSIGSSLVVTQTVTAHKQIEDLIESLRERAAPILVAEAILVRFGSGKASSWRAAVGRGFPILTEKEFGALTTTSEAQVLFKGATIGQNARRMWFSAITERQYLESISPAAAGGVIHEGLELIVVPALARFDEAVTLDIQLAVAVPAEVRERRVPAFRPPSGGQPLSEAAPAGSQPTAEGTSALSSSIDLVSRQLRTIGTTVTIPLGHAVALSVPKEPRLESSGDYQEEWLVVHVRRQPD